MDGSYLRLRVVEGKRKKISVKEPRVLEGLLILLNSVRVIKAGGSSAL